jgi:hypothetical protein
VTTDDLNSDREPLPRYAMPDGSGPEQKKSSACAGSSPATGKFFHEIVDHQKYGISDEEMQDAVIYDTGIITLPDDIHISPYSEMKFRALPGSE